MAACSKTLVRWCPPALRPKNWQSTMREIEVSGCQFLEWLWAKAQTIPETLRPGEVRAIELSIAKLPATLDIAADRADAVVTVNGVDVGVA